MAPLCAHGRPVDGEGPHRDAVHAVPVECAAGDAAKAADMSAKESSTAVSVVEGSSGAANGGPADQDGVLARKRDERRAIWKQFAASASVQCLHLMTGVCMAYSSSLIPALEAADSDIPGGKEGNGAMSVCPFPISSVICSNEDEDDTYNYNSNITKLLFFS